MKRKYYGHIIVLISILFLATSCGSKQPAPSANYTVGVATVVGTTGGVVLGGMIGGMMGMLVTGATGGTAPFIGVVVGAVSAGSLGYYGGRAIDN